MTTKERIRAKIERRMVELAKDKYIDLHDTLCRTKELNLLLSFLDTLEEPVSDCHDLEEAADEYSGDPNTGFVDMTAYRAFKAGAEWQKAKMMEEWLKDRDGCFWDGVNEGKKAMKEQIMEGAVGGSCIEDLTAGSVIDTEYGVLYLPPNKFCVGDKVRIIIVKEDGQ